jgi:ArsR family transcriptional regulator, arsenate/arsenite/antimonite-responsive transcriptional repressor
MERLVELAKIFSDINRLKILALSLRDKELCVCEICDTLELSQPLVSRHLKQMREAGILTSEQKGKWVIYSLVATPDTILECWIQEVSKELSSLPPLVGCNIK